jgi:hypothetical protein
MKPMNIYQSSDSSVSSASLVSSDHQLVQLHSKPICSTLGTMLTLSWDLFIVVFFAVVMSYGFLIGKDRSIQVAIASYVAIIATQGIGNILLRLTGSDTAVLRSVGIPVDITMVSLAKIFVFAIFIIIVVTRSGIEITHGKNTGTLLSLLYTALFGFSTAALLVSTVLTYAGSSSGILSSNLASSAVIAPLLQGSILLQIMVLNQDLWFTLPAFLIIAVGLVHGE